MATSKANMLFSGEPILAMIFTSAPWQVFIGTALVSTLLLILPAWLFRLHSIPTSQGNLGFFYSPNWSIMYVVVIPLLLAMAATVSERMKNCVIELEKTGRIVPSEGTEDETQSYGLVMSEFLRSWSGWLILIAATISVIATLVDTYNLWPGYLPGFQPPLSRKPEWDTAFNASNWPVEYNSPGFLAYVQRPPGKVANFAFDVVAYIFQTGILFLAFFWVGKFFLLLSAFAKVIGGHSVSHRFNPLATDLEFRMGLKPMGSLFDKFLAITLLIEGYAFIHRLLLIRPLDPYLHTLQKIVFPPTNPSVPYPFTVFIEIFKKESWALNGLDVSAVLTIVLMTVPIFVVCFLPLWRIRKFVELRRAEEIARLQEEYSAARAARDIRQVQMVEHERECLEKANIWPNGDQRAKSYLTIILALAAGALAPPLLAIVVVISLSDSLSKYFKFVFHKGSG